MSQRESRGQDAHSGLNPSDVRRERARLAQQRSRARTRNEIQNLYSRVEQQSNAIDEMTKIFLDFANGALSRSYVIDDQPAVTRIRDHMQRFLTVARSVMETDEPDDNDDQVVDEDANLESSPDLNNLPGVGGSDSLPNYSSDPEPTSMDVSLQESWPKDWTEAEANQQATVMPSSRIQNMSTNPKYSALTSYARPQQRPHSPLLLSHGILSPFLDTTARDGRRFLTDRRNVNIFAVQLYWNALNFGLSMLSSGGEEENALASQIFYYSLQHDLSANIIKRLRKRLNHIPKMSILFNTLAFPNNTTSQPHLSSSRPKPTRNISDSESDASDLDEEAEALRYIRELNRRVLKTMADDGEDMSNYLDVFAVQSRFLHVWGIDATAGLLSERKNQQKAADIGLESEPESSRSSSAYPQLRSFDHDSRRDHSQDLNYDYDGMITDTAPQQPSIQMAHLRDVLPQLNTSPAIQTYWTAKTMTSIWASIIMFLSLNSKCLGNSVTFPMAVVDEAARGILLTGAA